MKKILTLFATAALLAMASGCAVNRTNAIIDATTDLSKVKTVHVTKQAKDERGIDMLIADKLRTRGLKVTTGPTKPAAIDANVTYVDKWMWDITMYLLELTITFRDPQSDYPLATGSSYHTSLTRLAPPEMVNEVINNIYDKGKTQ